MALLSTKESFHGIVGGAQRQGVPDGFFPVGGAIQSGVLEYLSNLTSIYQVLTGTR
jgi:hypothetical protein